MSARPLPHLVPARQDALLDLAFCAAGLEASDPALSSRLASEALAHGDPGSCAAVFAACGSSALLSLALRHGADPEARAPRHRRLPDPCESEPEPRLLRLAFLARSEECCALLAAHGADPLPRIECEDPDEAAALSPLAPPFQAAGPYPWRCALAALGSTPSPAKATALARQLAPEASRFGDAKDPGACARAAMEGLAKLAELGADFSCPSPVASTPLGLWIYQRCTLAGTHRPSSAEGLPHVERAGAGFVGASPMDRLAACARALADGLASNASVLPPPPSAVHLRRIASEAARDCPADRPAALGVLLPAALCLPASLEARRGGPGSWPGHGRENLAFLFPQASSWSAPSAQAMALCRRAMAEALLASAARFGLAQPAAGASPEAHRGLWLELARLGPRGDPSVRGCEFPLECARLAAASHPELAAFFEEASALASAAALPDIEPAHLGAVAESLLLLPDAHAPARRSPSSRL